MSQSQKATVILGLKVIFKKLWEKIDTINVPICHCSVTDNDFTFCPHCGQKKGTKKIKVYRSLITGEESTVRYIDDIIRNLLPLGVGVFDVEPDGYSDSIVYLYLTNPYCLQTIDTNEPFSMMTFLNTSSHIEQKLKEIIGDRLWKSGEWGLWGFLSHQSNGDKRPRFQSPLLEKPLSPPPSSPPPPPTKRIKIDPLMLSLLTAFNPDPDSNSDDNPNPNTDA